jgi:hypothetical protein
MIIWCIFKDDQSYQKQKWINLKNKSELIWKIKVNLLKKYMCKIKVDKIK